jgi:cell division protein FtsQ
LAISTSRPAEWFRSQSRRRRAAIVAAGLTCLSVGALVASRTSAFDARRIEVTGARHLRPADVVRTAGVSSGTNVLWFDERAAERRLEAEPWIAHADVSGAFPLRIQIEITERTPVAVLAGGTGDLIAGDGTVLGTRTGVKGLPRIELGVATSAEGKPSSPVGAARVLGAMAPGLRSDVREVRVLLDGTLELRLEGGPRVRFGTPGDAEAKVAAMRRVLAWAHEKGSVIRRLSVVAPAAPAATLVP